jgi:predicted dehydrogenase
MFRAAVIGCGQIAGLNDDPSDSSQVRTHAKAYDQNSMTSIVAAADQDIDRAFDFAARWDIRGVYGDVRKLLAIERPEIVSVCTPDDAHASVLEMCLDVSSIRAVWCEKPLTLDSSQAEALVADFKAKGVMLAVNYQRRWDPEMSRIKRAIQQGELGRIDRSLVHYTQGIYHNGSHAIDLLFDWLGTDVKHLHIQECRGAVSQNDPNVKATFDLGQTRVSFIGVERPRNDLFEIQILGRLGRVYIKNFGASVEWFFGDADPDRTARHPDRVGGPCNAAAMAIALDDILNAVLNGRGLRSDGATALETLKLCCQLTA